MCFEGEKINEKKLKKIGNLKKKKKKIWNFENFWKKWKFEILKIMKFSGKIIFVKIGDCLTDSKLNNH